MTADGAMAEVGATRHPSSYIETNGSTVTRSGDTLSYKWPAALDNSSEISMLCHYVPWSIDSDSLLLTAIEDWSTSLSDYASTVEISNAVSFIYWDGDLFGLESSTAAAAPNAGAINKLGGYWKSGEHVAVFLNGVKTLATGTIRSGTIDGTNANALSRIEVGSRASAGGIVARANLPISNVEIYNAKLDDAIMIAKTT